MEQQKRFHESFAQFFKAPTRETLRELLRVNLGETDQLDFKKSWPNLTKTAKHVIAIGNSGGGAIVFGVREEDDGSLTAVGLDKLFDKSEVGNEFQKYIPSELEYEVILFDLSASEYAEIEGDKYQVILVDPDAEKIPYLPIRGSKGIKENRIYVRRDTKSVEANRFEIERLVETRVNAVAESKKSHLENELEQLKILYHQLASAVNPFFNPTNYLFDDGYREFLDELIQGKKEQIREGLGL